MKASATVIIIPTHCGTVPSCVIIASDEFPAILVDTDADTGLDVTLAQRVPLRVGHEALLQFNTPVLPAAIDKFCNTINPTARTTATPTILKMNPCMFPSMFFKLVTVFILYISI